jgi:tetratricopeptide (TPR) repeat protein
VVWAIIRPSADKATNTTMKIFLIVIFSLMTVAYSEAAKSNAEALAERAVARFARGDVDGASKDFAEAIATDPSCVPAYLGRAALRFRAGDFEGALRDYTRVIKPKPKLSIGYVSRGAIRQFKGDYEGSIADYTKVICLEPKATRGLIARAYALSKT